MLETLYFVLVCAVIIVLAFTVLKAFVKVAIIVVVLLALLYFGRMFLV